MAALYFRDFCSIFSRACGAAACTIVILGDSFLTEAQHVAALYYVILPKVFLMPAAQLSYQYDFGFFN